MARRFATWPAVPGNNGTIVLFATHDRLAGGSGANYPGLGKGDGFRGVSRESVHAVEVVFHRHDQASASNGLRLYALDDGNTWRETDLKDNNNAATIGSAVNVQVPALSAGQEARYMLDVSRYRGWALEYTAGATAPTNWNGTIVLHLDVEVMTR